MHVPILRGCKSCSEPIAGQRGSREGLRHQHRTRSSVWKSCSESRATECHRPTAQTLFLLLFASQPALPLLLARLGYPEPLTSRPDTPPNTQRKDKTGKGSGATEARPLPALLQRSRPSLPAPGGIASLQIPPRGQLPGSRGGRSSAPRAAPQPRGGRTSQGADAAQEPSVFVRVHRTAGGPAAQQDALGWRRPAAQRSPHHRCPLATAALRFLIRGLRRDLPWMRPPLLLANEPHARPPPPAPAGGRGSDVL